MPPVDDRTVNRNYPKPSPANSLSDDVVRLRDALDDIDLDINNGTASRDTSSAIINLANGANGTTAITLPKSSLIISVQSDKASTVILYSSSAAATADSGRSWTTIAPTAGDGVICQVTLSAAGTQQLSPAANAINQEAIPSTSYTMRVINNGTSGDVTVTIKFLKLEA